MFAVGTVQSSQRKARAKLESFRRPVGGFANWLDGFQDGMGVKITRDDREQFCLDCDGLQLSGVPRILYILCGGQVAIEPHTPHKNANRLILTTTGFEVTIDTGYKEALCGELNARVRHFPFVKSDKDQNLYNNKITVSTDDLVESLRDVGCETVHVNGYGAKGCLDAAMEMVKSVFESYPGTTCTMDVGLQIPTGKLHWITGDHMAPVKFDEEGNYVNDNITLFATLDRGSVLEHYGENTKIHNYPTDCLSQMEESRFMNPPIGGGVTIIPGDEDMYFERIKLYDSRHHVHKSGYNGDMVTSTRNKKNMNDRMKSWDRMCDVIATWPNYARVEISVQLDHDMVTNYTHNSEWEDTPEDDRFNAIDVVAGHDFFRCVSGVLAITDIWQISKPNQVVQCAFIKDFMQDPKYFKQLIKLCGRNDGQTYKEPQKAAAAIVLNALGYASERFCRYLCKLLENGGFTEECEIGYILGQFMIWRAELCKRNGHTLENWRDATIQNTQSRAIWIKRGQHVMLLMNRFQPQYSVNGNNMVQLSLPNSGGGTRVVEFDPSVPLWNMQNGMATLTRNAWSGRNPFSSTVFKVEPPVPDTDSELDVDSSGEDDIVTEEEATDDEDEEDDNEEEESNDEDNNGTDDEDEEEEKEEDDSNDEDSNNNAEEQEDDSSDGLDGLDEQLRGIGFDGANDETFHDDEEGEGDEEGEEEEEVNNAHSLTREEVIERLDDWLRITENRPGHFYLYRVGRDKVNRRVASGRSRAEVIERTYNIWINRTQDWNNLLRDLNLSKMGKVQLAHEIDDGTLSQWTH